MLFGALALLTQVTGLYAMDDAIDNNQTPEIPKKIEQVNYPDQTLPDTGWEIVGNPQEEQTDN